MLMLLPGMSKPITPRPIDCESVISRSPSRLAPKDVVKRTDPPVRSLRLNESGATGFRSTSPSLKLRLVTTGSSGAGSPTRTA